MKLLFTSVGRRVELIQAFKNAAERLGTDLCIIGGDVSISAPALYYCDRTIILPPIRDNQYIPFLVDFCKKECVDALIPTIDTDLLILADNRKLFEQTKVIISSPDKVRLCRDKLHTAEYFNSIDLKCPITVDDLSRYTGPFPAFIKPKNGSSSINAYRADNKKQLAELVQIVPDYIIQPFVVGTEYSIDIFCDFEGNPVFITPRIRLAVRAGEVLKTEVHQDQRIVDEMKRLIKNFKPCGAITIQMIRDRYTDEDYYIEINPRYGGGAPLSIKAGADSAEMIIRLLHGEKVGFIEGAAENGAIYSRFDQSIRIDKR